MFRIKKLASTCVRYPILPTARQQEMGQILKMSGGSRKSKWWWRYFTQTPAGKQSREDMILISFKCLWYHSGKYNQTESQGENSSPHWCSLNGNSLQLQMVQYHSTYRPGLHVFILLLTSSVWFTIWPARRRWIKITKGSDTVIKHHCFYLQMCPKMHINHTFISTWMCSKNSTHVIAHQFFMRWEKKDSDTQICNHWVIHWPSFNWCTTAVACFNFSLRI